HLLRALDFNLSPTKQVALVGDNLSGLVTAVRSTFRPHLVLAGGPESTVTPALLQGRPMVEGHPTAYVCEHFACQAPVITPEALGSLL
ncbi:MAG: thioredoxin domain-containing protein, partial [Steroidobacteraceae bacterium]